MVVLLNPEFLTHKVQSPGPEAFLFFQLNGSDGLMVMVKVCGMPS